MSTNQITLAVSPRLTERQRGATQVERGTSPLRIPNKETEQANSDKDSSGCAYRSFSVLVSIFFGWNTEVWSQSMGWYVNAAEHEH